MTVHRIERVLPFAADQLFDLAANVERYPEFVPWWAAARVVRRDRGAYETDQVVRVGVFRHRFRSRTVLRRPERIEVTSSDRAFRRFDLTWTFDPLASGACRVGLSAEIEFRHVLYARVFVGSLAGTLDGIVAAFERRLAQVHGSGPGQSRLNPDQFPGKAGRL